MEQRIGFGYDLHRTVKGRKLIIGGVDIPCEFGLDGHSDADVLVHALCDALLGAISMGDIGTHFPDNNPEYKNADSMKLLEKVVAMVSDAGYKVVNIDSVIIAEKPKMFPYKAQMIENIAKVLKISNNAVSVKAKTNEGVDAIGKGEAIAAHVVALLGK
ncbi:MAG: 2-C-methyl-D-erythritol 2,4-cyclodiphosphate synthase [Bacteroidales bacterium]|nr:2-C-methyl-D-erythritol 2,4-cyclodiphosphate synthase [Bacteroidales bacterium]